MSKTVSVAALLEDHGGPIIALTQGMIALIDEDSLPLVGHLSWFAARARQSSFYAHHTAWDGTKNVTVRMHRIIARAEPGQVVDHINGCGLDNRRSNLRICTSGQNSWNQKKRKGSSRYRGVTLSKTGNRWHAMIGVNGKLRWIGSFMTEDEAARAYDDVAQSAYGEFARLNFPVSI